MRPLVKNFNLKRKEVDPDFHALFTGFTLKVSILLVSILCLGVHLSNAQATISVSFGDGFVGDEDKNNKAINAVTHSSLGWSNVQFEQNTNAVDGSGKPIFEAQGNDVIGNVLITDFNGDQHVIPGYINWRAPSGSVTTVVFVPTSDITLDISPSGTYSILRFDDMASYSSGVTGEYTFVGLTFNGETAPSGTVTGNAAGTVDALNTYLAAQPQLSIGDATVNEGDGTVTLNVSLSAASTDVITVNYATQDVSATSGSDYTSNTGTLTFLAGETTKTITVTITDDGDSESSETLNAILSDVKLASIIDNTGVITITDNDLPPNNSPAAADKTLSTDEDTHIVIATADLGYSDLDSDPLNYTTITTLPLNGTLYVDADGDNEYDAGEEVGIGNQISKVTLDAGDLQFVPEANENGTNYASFDFNVNDGTDDAATDNTITFDVNAVNDAPTAIVDNYVYDEGSSNSETTGTGVLDNDTDVENNILSAILVSDVSNGMLTLNADGSFDYEHDGSETTSDSFTYKVNDGSVDGNTVTVNIAITPQNDAPVAAADEYTYEAGSSNSESVVNGVLTNDSDAESNTLSAILVSDVSNGTLTLNADGSFDYIHDGSATTSDSFTYKVNDGSVDGNTVTVSINIISNNPPVAMNGAGTVEDLSGLNSSVSTLANDLDGDNLIFSIVGSVSSGELILNGDGTFEFTPSVGFEGDVSFTYQVCDDGTPTLCDQAVFTITVLPIDTDGDGITDAEEGTEDTDGDGTPNYLDEDADGDGIPDAEEGNEDTDGDGIPDNEDTDADGDGIPDSEEGNEDVDGDGIPDNEDTDADGDGIPDSEEGNEDVDGDGIPDNEDTDADGDGIPDAEEGNEDTDGDGIPDNEDTDADGDGIPDNEDTDDENVDFPTTLVLTNNGDNLNDSFEIQGINNYPNNKVIIFNRWGNVVWEITGYANDDPSRSFSGNANAGSINNTSGLPDGTYYYVIDRGNGSDPQKGFVVIKR